MARDPSEDSGAPPVEGTPDAATDAATSEAAPDAASDAANTPQSDEAADTTEPSPDLVQGASTSPRGVRAVGYDGPIEAPPRPSRDLPSADLLEAIANPLAEDTPRSEGTPRSERPSPRATLDGFEPRLEPDRSREGDPLRATPTPHESRPSLVMSAVRVLDSLDVMTSTKEHAAGSVILRPGRVPLALITLSGMVCIGLAFTQALFLSTEQLQDYVIPFGIAYIVLLVHLLAYHTAYHTRRRFMAFRQMFYLSSLVAFLSWIIVDLERRPELTVSLNPTTSNRLQMIFWSNLVLAGLIVLHWLILGRGHHRIVIAARKARPPKEPPSDAKTREGASDAPKPDAS